MSKRLPNILKRREKNKGASTTNSSNTTTLGGNTNVIMLECKVSNYKEDLSNKDIWKVSSDDSDIEIISSSVKPKKRTLKSFNIKSKCSTSVLKRSKTELKSPVFKQHKLIPTVNKNIVSKDKLTNNETQISIEDILDLKDTKLSSANKNLENNENMFNDFQSEDISATPQLIDKIYLNTDIVLKQSKNESKVTKQSKTHVMLSNHTDLKDKTINNEIGISFKDLYDDDKFPYVNDDLNNVENVSNINIEDTSKNCLPLNENLDNYLNPNDYINIVTFKSKQKTELQSKSTKKYKILDFPDPSACEELQNVKNNKSLLDKKEYVNDKAKIITPSANYENDETDIYEMDDTLGGLSDDSKSISNFDVNDKGLVDSLPPKNDPSIINNAPLNISNVSNTFLSTDDTETLNSLVRLKCNNCLELVQCPKVEPQMQCQKCCSKYQYQCKICTSGFVSLYSLYTHLIKFHSRGDAVHNLMIKPQYFKKPRQIRRLQCDSNELYNCQKCGSSFRLKTIRDKHETICSRNPKLNCPFCSLAMSFRKNLKEHMITLHSESFEVNEVDSIVNKIVKDGNKKRKNMKAESLLQMLQVSYCCKCDRRTPVHKLLDEYTTCTTCGENLTFICTDPDCSRSFATAKALNSHVRMLHVEKRDHYRCAHCLYATTSRRDLIRHQKGCGDLVILPPRLFVCPNCGKGFKKERYLQVHLQRPEGCACYKQRELVCSKCKRTFRTQHWLENHRCEPVTTQPKPSEPLFTELVPLEEPEYPCPDCGKIFKQMRWFDAHRKKYCDKQRVLYRCAHCRYQGFDKKKLKVHMRCAHIHLCTGKKLCCTKCGTKWTSIYCLNRHMDNCSGNYETERVKMRRRKKKKTWEEMFEYI